LPGYRCFRIRIQRQQGLGIGIEIVHFLDHELRPGLHHLLYRAALDGTQDALAVLGGDIRRQFDLDLEDLLVAVFRVDNIVLRQADVVGGNIAGRSTASQSKPHTRPMKPESNRTAPAPSHRPYSGWADRRPP
jgi:hypothetical protein